MRFLHALLYQFFLYFHKQICLHPMNLFTKILITQILILLELVKNKGKGEYKIRTVQPLNINEESGDTIFIQGWWNFDQFGKYRIGTNLGLGFRNFSNDNTKMYGYNFFYDSEPDPGHHRLGLGLELKQPDLEFQIIITKVWPVKNLMWLSGMKEEVLDGVDIIVSGLIPRFEWIETDLSYAYWDSVASSDLYEIKLGLNFSLNDYLTMKLEAEDDNKSSITYNAGISINFGGKKSNKVSLFGSNQNIVEEDMRAYNLIPVKRSEKLTLEQTGGFSVKVKKSG